MTAAMPSTEVAAGVTAWLYLALQLKARQAGLPTPVYGRQEVHHLR